MFSLDDLAEFLQENFSKVSVVLGLVLLFSGLLFLETFGSVWSASCIFLGLVLTAFGLFFHLGLFSDLHSLSGIGGILIFASIVFFALSVSLFQFLDVNSVSVVKEIFRGAALPFKKVILHTERPLLWLCSLFFWLGVSFFACGLIVKIAAFHI